MFVFPLFLVICFAIDVSSVSYLKYFETFSSIGISTRIKRFANDRELYKQVKFNAFDRSFAILLKSGTEVLADGFSAKLVGQDGHLTSFYVDQSKLYSGYLLDQPDVRVTAHTEDMLLSIQIFDKNDTYSIEPAQNILHPSENPKNHTMVAYRSSDISHIPGKCGVEHPNLMLNETRFSVMRTGDPGRKRRNLSGDTCVIFLAADYDFFNNRCNRHFLRCSSLMINFIQNANDLFRKSTFKDALYNTYTGIGLQIGMLVLYTTYTYTADTYRFHFNAKGVQWNHQSKLDSFSFYVSLLSKNYCLFHLLTSYPMPNHIWGYSFEQQICESENRSYRKNTGFTSDVDEVMGPLLSQQLNLVLTHGHNFGSPHDPPGCSPSESSGGSYLMWGGFITGEYPNNKKFSPCSLISIGEVIATKSSCFFPKHTVVPLCGNGIVETGEECDAGAIGIVDGDLCCSKYCRYFENAVCSDMNTQCCANCQLASYSTVCHEYGGTDCKKKSYCSGRSFFCPPPQDMDDFLPCLDGRLCYNGECMSMCEIYSAVNKVSLKPCLCQSNEEDACKWCCFDNSDPAIPGDCVPISDDMLKDGRPCYSGFCQNGMCTKNISESLFPGPYIRKAISHGLSEFFKRNIVLTVCLINLMFFVPIACVLCYLDRRNVNKLKELKEMLQLSSVQRKNPMPPQNQTNKKIFSRNIKKPALTPAPTTEMVPLYVAVPLPYVAEPPVTVEIQNSRSTGSSLAGLAAGKDLLTPDQVSTYSMRLGETSQAPDALVKIESATSYSLQRINTESTQTHKVQEDSGPAVAVARKGTLSSIDSYMKKFIIPFKKRQSLGSSSASHLSKVTETSTESRTDTVDSKERATQRKHSHISFKLTKDSAPSENKMMPSKDSSAATFIKDEHSV